MHKENKYIINKIETMDILVLDSKQETGTAVCSLLGEDTLSDTITGDTISEWVRARPDRNILPLLSKLRSKKFTLKVCPQRLNKTQALCPDSPQQSTICSPHPNIYQKPFVHLPVKYFKSSLQIKQPHALQALHRNFAENLNISLPTRQPVFFNHISFS